jgi:hypothetical protein
MTYQSIEPEVEAVLIAAIEEALEDAEITATVRGWWNDETDNEGEEKLAFPQVNVEASPNIPQGYREPLRFVPVSLSLVTFEPDDKARQTILAIYDAIREILDEDDFTSTTLGEFPAVEILDSSSVTIDGGAGLLNIITLQLTVHVCLGAQ